MAENVLTTKMGTLVHASALTGELIVKVWYCLSRSRMTSYSSSTSSFLVPLATVYKPVPKYRLCFFFWSVLKVDDCDQCDIHAICVQGACRCRVGYKGDGFECEKVKRCHHCSPNATCISNECVCKPGFIGNGKHCRCKSLLLLAFKKPATIAIYSGRL